MPRRQSPLASLLDAPAVRAAAEALVAAVADETRKRTLPVADYEKALAEIGRLRGRPLLFPALASGAGAGAWVRLADGRELLDFIGGIGVYGLGHADRDPGHEHPGGNSGCGAKCGTCCWYRHGAKRSSRAHDSGTGCCGRRHRFGGPRRRAPAA